MKKTSVNQDEIEVFGRVYKDPDQTDPNEFMPGSITLHLQKSKLRMGDKPTPKVRRKKTTVNEEPIFGLPIDVDLAVHLIRNAVCEMKKLKHPFNGNDKDQEKAFNFVKSLLNVTAGITYDKTVVLQILSQPNCEGLRAYPCSRSDNSDDASLVLVGVDADGFDLSYPPGFSLSKGLTATTTTSLTIEYGFPPVSGPGIFLAEQKLAPDLPNYTLLAAANELGCPEGK